MLRILAPYTVYNGAVYKLHLFEIADDGCVSHCPVEKETADTLYVQGIAIFGGNGLDTEALNALIRSLSDSRKPIADIAADIADRCTATDAKIVLTATFPFQSIQLISNTE